MTLISLGYACLVRQSIDQFNGYRVETNYFDWLLTNFTTILFILQHLEKPESYLTHDRFTDKGIESNNPTHRNVTHNELYFISLHDFPAEKGYWEYIQEFIEKYQRRANRLISIIKTCSEKINFIHYIAFKINIPTIEQIYFFIVEIQKINPYCNFCLNLLIPPDLYHEKGIIDILQINNNIKIHYMISDGSPINLQRTDLNWNSVYNQIKIQN
jgi:hypothetical protein